MIFQVSALQRAKPLLTLETGEKIMKFKLLITFLSIITLATSVIAAPLKGDAQTRRIPAGTKLKLQLIDPVSTQSGSEGDYFSAMLMEDQKSPTGVILPAGSIVRGSINKITKNRMLSRGAVLYIDFDHVVTPNGRQLPISLSVANRTNITYDGGLYESKGYGEAIKDNFNKSIDITKVSTRFGVDVGEKTLGGAPMVITVPLCSLGGAIGGGAYFFGDSTIDLFRKGKNVILDQGQEIYVILTNAIDVPVN